MQRVSQVGAWPHRSLVSTIIPARDAARCVGRAIESVLAQNYRPLEIVVVDDGSRDATADIVRRYGEPVRLVQLSESRGPAAARNIGIATARGEYVAFLDADDEWLPDKVAWQMSVIECSPNMTFVYCNAVYAGEGVPKPVNSSSAPGNGYDFWKALLARSIVCTPTVLARRDAVLRAGMFDPELPTAEDQDLWIRLARLGEVGYVEKDLTRVHDTPGSVTKLRASERIVHTLRVVDRQIQQATGELTNAEISAVYAERYASLGRDAFQNGFIAPGLRLLFRAVRLGQPALPTIWFALMASPLGALAKRIIGWRSDVSVRGASVRNQK